MASDRTEGLPPWIVGLGWLMRRIPRGPRKLEYWWWLLFQRIGCGMHFDDPGERHWPEGRFTVRGRHGVKIVAGLTHWSGRWDYFRGSYYQDDIVFLMEHLIRKGDVFVDAGANRGMVTALAGRLVGPSGSVHAFEPNPRLLGTLNHHIEINHLKNVTVINRGLSDREGEATIVATANMGLGWVALDGLPAGEEGHTIHLLRGDDALGGLDPSRPVILKMDVEGHEVHALRGLSRFLDRRELAAIIEVSGHNLSRAGSTPQDLFRLMMDHGFDAFRFDIDQSRWRRSLRLTPLEGPLPNDPYDAFFIRPGTALWHRVAPHVTASPSPAAAAAPASP